MDISSIHFHDTKIHRIVEDVKTKTLTMEVSYPVDWDRNIFEERMLVFEDVRHYQVLEWELFGGEPTILDAKIVSRDDRWSRLSIETNAGRRELSCRSVRLSEPRLPIE